MLYYVSNLDLSNGYKMQWQPFDQAYLANESAIAAEPTVLSIDFSGDFIAGIRIPSTHFDCGAGQPWLTQYSDENGFFIVNTLSHERMSFDSQAAFESQLESMGLADSIFMDYEAFYRIGASLRSEQPNDNELLNCQKVKVSLND